MSGIFFIEWIRPPPVLLKDTANLKRIMKRKSPNRRSRKGSILFFVRRI